MGGLFSKDEVSYVEQNTGSSQTKAEPKGNSEEAKASETTTKASETTPKACECETTTKACETTPNPSETTPKPSETTPKPSETTPRASETTPKPSETTPKPSETTPKPSETTPRASETTPKPSETTPKARTPQVKLPHNCEAIIKEADSPLDRSSVNKLLDQLCAGVLLDQKRKKYWVDKKSNSNCFFLYAKNLSITWANSAGNNPYWRWSNIQETSDTFVDVAELLDVCWLEAHAKFETAKLSPGTLYEAAFVIMLKDTTYGWEVPVNFRLITPGGQKQEHTENLMQKPRNQWMEIPVGQFVASPEKTGEMEISVYEYQGGKWKRGLVIKGIAIRPKK